MAYNFIKQLTESALIRNEKALKNYNARDIADIIFLYFLALQLLRNEFISAPDAANYANNTIKWGDIDHFRNSATDLYILMYTLFGANNQSTLKMLADQEANDIFLQNTQFDYPQAKSWLQKIAKSKEPSRQDNQFLIRLESMLLIRNGDYKSVRRLVSDWGDLDLSSKQLAMTRILMALRYRARKSELLPILEKVAKEQNLELKDVKNPETGETATKKSFNGASIGAAIGGALVANSIRKFFQHAHKGKKFD